MGVDASMEGDVLLALVGARIKELRNQKKLSQVQLAEKAESQDTYIGEIERGSRNISLKMLAKIADALEVSVVELLDFRGIKEDEMPQKQQVVEIVKAELGARSLEDVRLVQRMISDMFQTIDNQYHHRK